MLLVCYRGVLPPEAVSSVHTFGAPAVFCEGASGAAPSGGPCSSCALPCEHKAAAVAAFEAASGIHLPPPAGSSSVSDVAAPGAQQRVVLRGLLEQLGLRPEVVRNVIMTRDIVPRAFVCDYTMIAEMLKSWMPSFKEHVGLAPCKPHKVRGAGSEGRTDGRCRVATSSHAFTCSHMGQLPLHLQSAAHQACFACWTNSVTSLAMQCPTHTLQVCCAP